jgi:hypothetical protein
MLDKARATDAARSGRPPLSRAAQAVLHQRRTVANFVEVEQAWSSMTTDESPFIPVLQGDSPNAYLRCADLYRAAGVDLTRYPLVGIGSVCRLQAMDLVGDIVRGIKDYVDAELPVHLFGMKKLGVRKHESLITAADSLAWSIDARYMEPLPGCSHKNCANCARFALRWYDDLHAGLAVPA